MTELIRQNGDWPFLISTTGSGAVWQQMAGGFGKRLTTAPGGVVSGTANRLKAADGGPALLQDFVLREKIFHRDHARSPERVVHVRGYGAHGAFTCIRAVADLTRGRAFFGSCQNHGCFMRFPTLAGSKGSPDLPRDIRGVRSRFMQKIELGTLLATLCLFSLFRAP